MMRWKNMVWRSISFVSFKSASNLPNHISDIQLLKVCKEISGTDTKAMKLYNDDQFGLFFGKLSSQINTMSLDMKKEVFNSIVLIEDFRLFSYTKSILLDLARSLTENIGELSLADKIDYYVHFKNLKLINNAKMEQILNNILTSLRKGTMKSFQKENINIISLVEFWSHLNTNRHEDSALIQKIENAIYNHKGLNQIEPWQFRQYFKVFSLSADQAFIDKIKEIIIFKIESGEMNNLSSFNDVAYYCAGLPGYSKDLQDLIEYKYEMLLKDPNQKKSACDLGKWIKLLSKNKIKNENLKSQLNLHLLEFFDEFKAVEISFVIRFLYL